VTPPIRVLVANRPKLMRELVIETIMDHADIEFIAEIQNEDEIIGAVNGAHPDFLIIALDESNQRPALCDTLLRLYPEMKILALAPERNRGIFYWASFGIYETQVESSQAGILSTIRGKNQCVGG
jgi:chemotaxis response regulator CheB